MASISPITARSSANRDGIWARRRRQQLTKSNIKELNRTISPTITIVPGATVEDTRFAIIEAKRQYSTAKIMLWLAQVEEESEEQVVDLVESDQEVVDVAVDEQPDDLGTALFPATLNLMQGMGDAGRGVVASLTRFASVV